MTPRARKRVLPMTAAVVALATLVGCGSSGSGSVSSADTVALHPDGAPSPMTVGVVVSLTSDPGEGSDWSAAAEGAQVAAYRLGAGGVKVRLEPVNDKGTAQGLRDAVRTLVDGHVSGIVLASSGDHVRAGLQEAAGSGVPVLLPYAAPAGDLPGNSWSTGPDADQVGTALTRALAQASLTRPLLLDAGGGEVAHLSPIARVVVRPGQDLDQLARSVGRTARARHADAVVVSGPAEIQGQVVAALQGAGPGLPVLLTPAALSPEFGTALTAAGGSLDADLTTVGTPGLDATTLQPGAAGRSAAAFYEALRGAAGDRRLQDFFDGRPYAEVAPAADTRSHDAVLAVVAAAARAGGDGPAQVAAALRHLRAGAANGLAGAPLDLTRPEALADRDLVVLHATTQDPGVLPDGAASQIHWFATPTS